MRIVVTGTPGTGKSSVAKRLAKKLCFLLVNEKEFALKHNIGKWDKENELVVDLKKLEQALNLFIAGHKSIILEGHLLCELRLKASLVFVLIAGPEIVLERLSKRGYSDEKLLDNVFAEEQGYCLKKAKKNYPGKKIIIVDSKKSIKETTRIMLLELKKIHP